MSMRQTSLGIALCFLLTPAPVLAYGIKLHGLFPSHTFQGLPNTPLSTGPEEMARFRTAVYAQLRSNPHPDLQRRFLKRYPEPFTAWTFKEFLMLNPAKTPFV